MFDHIVHLRIIGVGLIVRDPTDGRIVLARMILGTVDLVVISMRRKTASENPRYFSDE